MKNRFLITQMPLAIAGVLLCAVLATSCKPSVIEWKEVFKAVGWVLVGILAVIAILAFIFKDFHITK